MKLKNDHKQEGKDHDSEYRKQYSYRIPETEDLRKKYPVMHPTTDYSEMADEMREALLQNFEAWNEGAKNFDSWTGKYCATDMKYRNNKDQLLSLSEAKDAAKAQMEKEEVKRLYFDSMLLSGEWAAIHYRTVGKNPETGEKEAGERMQFFRFEKTADGVKITDVWTK